MNIKTSLKAGLSTPTEERRPYPPPPPPPQYGYTCDHCKGQPLGGGTIGSATCNSCW